ncbi:MAG: DUF2917 domain-containing protein [Betaproteobacteria bacterium]
MLCNGYTKVWDLASGELIKLDGARGTTLRVTRGTLWLTFEHDTRDIVLDAGDTFTIDRGGLTLVEAQRDATVCVLAHYIDEVLLPRRRPSLAGTVARWLGSVDAADVDRRWAPYY